MNYNIISTLTLRLMSLTLCGYLLIGCSEDDCCIPPVSPERIAYIMNEGNFGSANASISSFMIDSASVQDATAQASNIGDVLQDAQLIDGDLWIVLNNSNRVEIRDISDLTIKSTIDIFQPRFLATESGSDRVYISTSSEEIIVADRTSRNLIDTLSLPRAVEQIVLQGSTLYGAQRYRRDFSPGDQLYRINTATAAVDSFQLFQDPAAMTQDAEGALWIVCSGDVFGSATPGGVMRYQPGDEQVDTMVAFTDVSISFGPRITTSPDANTIYYLKDQLYRVGLDGSNPTVLVPDMAEGPLYALDVDPVSGEIYIGDPRDFSARGRVFRISADGTEVLAEITAGFIPNRVLFTN